MLTLEQEIELLKSILQVTSDEEDYAAIAKKIIQLNDDLKEMYQTAD